ncbi:MAG: peptidoglycan DD-metalloendopeptidase family protein [Deltaproteobacteria bacterium]|nr:peptidoglycan DD-metalloendopeptidase family protein [Deltaproteobacteria bacterium]
MRSPRRPKLTSVRLRARLGGVAASPIPAKRRRRPLASRGSTRLVLLLVGLTAVNVYVFYFRKGKPDVAVAPTSLSQSLVDQKAERLADLSHAGELAATPGTERKEAAAGAIAAGDNQSRVIEGEFGKQDSLSTVLAREGFGDVALTVSAALAKIVDPKTIWPGHKYVLAFDESGQPERMEYRPSQVVTVVVSRQADGTWVASKHEKPVELRVENVVGRIDSSLYGSVQNAGESPALVAMLVDLFAWDINFYTDQHPGDHWKVVIEKRYLEGRFQGYGHVLAAEYGGKVGRFRAFRYVEGKREGYFDEKGQAIAKSFLKTPLRYVRVSSKFDLKRFHPVLHMTRAHLGIDYAAPTGTPVWAAANGKVVEASMKRGSGNTVVIRHESGYQSRYYHLSKFAKGVVAGARVQQKQVIGYVGTTGLSTGPHLHFGLTLNGGYVDPMKVKGMRDNPVGRPKAYREAIASEVRALDALDAKLAHNSSAGDEKNVASAPVQPPL